MLRTALLTMLAALATTTVACGGSDSSGATTALESSSNANDREAPPAFDLTGQRSEGTPVVDMDAARAAVRSGESTTVPTDGSKDNGSQNTPTPTPVAPSPDPGPAPTAQCSVTKDEDGFFVRNSGKSDYVAYIPASYSPATPMRAVVGLHGCSDDMENFARWGVNPWDTRQTQSYIGISVGGETGNNHCWSMGGDDDKVLAALDDLSKCFWIHRAKVVISGYSSGGQLAYRVGLSHADRFAGILIENSGLYAAGSDPDALLAGAAWKLPIAHRAHSSDSVFPIAKVKADWAKTTAAGFPLQTSEAGGGHDGTSADWVNFLLPAGAGWIKP